MVIGTTTICITMLTIFWYIHVIERNSYIKFHCISKWFWKHLVFESFSSLKSICNNFLTNVKRYPRIQKETRRIICMKLIPSVKKGKKYLVNKFFIILTFLGRNSFFLRGLIHWLLALYFLEQKRTVELRLCQQMHQPFVPARRVKNIGINFFKKSLLKGYKLQGYKKSLFKVINYIIWKASEVLHLVGAWQHSQYQQESNK